MRSSRRQSLESPMAGSLKLSPPGLASTQTRLKSGPQLEGFILSAELCRRTLGGAEGALNAQSSLQPPEWRDKGKKRFKNTYRLKLLCTKMIKL